MKLHINENNITRGAVYYPEWTEQYFNQVLKNLKHGLNKENEKINIRTKGDVVSNLTEGYARLKTRFVVDMTQMDDEYDTLIRMIDIMPYGQYREFVSLVIAPYQDLEYDDESIQILKEYDYSAGIV